MTKWPDLSPPRHDKRFALPLYSPVGLHWRPPGAPKTGKHMFALINALRRRNQPPTHELFDRSSIQARAGIFDIDLNWHMNNASYLKYMDRGRLEHAVTTGLLARMLSARCNLVVANTEISYIRELLPWQVFWLRTRLLGWDEKYVYYDQRFDVGGKLHTHALVRCVTLHEKNIVTPEAFQDMTGFKRRSPALPEYIESWKTMLRDKKRYSQFMNEEKAQN